MPRNYEPVPKSYSESTLNEAIAKVKKGELSIRQAALQYKIDKSLIWRRLHNLNTSKQGRKTVLSTEEERDLAEKIRIMAKWGWALTRKEIREMVHQYVVQNNLKNNFKGDYPGKDWLQLFFKRHGLVTKKMEQLEKSRREATSDPFIIYDFFDILHESLTALQLHDKPSQVFNLDETSFSSDPTRVKGATGKGQKAHRIIQGSGKDNTTVLGCISAAGDLPPLIIFKAQNLWSSWKGTNDIPGTTYGCSETGWMMTTIFNEWFEKFCQTVKERPLLVIFDGHATHLDPATIKLAIRENVAILKLPPHTTDLLQPMDRCCFGPLKYKWNERLIEWQRLNQRPLNKSEFADLLGEIWRDGISKEVIQKSFKVTGIFPVNKNAYPKDRLDPLKLEKYNQMKSSNTPFLTTSTCEEPPVENRDGRDSPSVLGVVTSSSLVQAVVQGTESESISKTSLTEIGQHLRPEWRLSSTDYCDSHIISNPEASCSFKNPQATTSDYHNIPNLQTSCSLENTQPGLGMTNTTPLTCDYHNISNVHASCSFDNPQPGLSLTNAATTEYDNIPDPKAACSFETLLLSKIKSTKPMTVKRRKIDGKGKLLTSDEYLKSIENLETTRNLGKKTGVKKTESKKKKGKPKITKRLSNTDTDTGEDEIKPKYKKQKPKTKRPRQNRISDSDTDIKEDATKPKEKKQNPKTTKGKSDNETDIGEDEIKPKKKKKHIPNTMKGMSDTDTDFGEFEIPYDDESDLENINLAALIEDHLDEEYNEIDHESDVMENRKPRKEPETVEMGDLDYGVGDFVILGHNTKKGKSYYIARIEGSDDDDKDNLSVIYLKRGKKMGFVYPETRVIYSVNKDEIVMKLPFPMTTGKRGGLMFNIDLEKYNIN